MASEGSKAANDAPDGTKTIDEEQLPSKEDILALVNKIDDPETHTRTSTDTHQQNTHTNTHE